jgi:hypothetical protein
MVTSNHIHLIVVDDGDKDAIPNSMKLVAGRTGQEYNQRKNRKGAYWEDRYHATAVESGDHLARCMVYIDIHPVKCRVPKSVAYCCPHVIMTIIPIGMIISNLTGQAWYVPVWSAIQPCGLSAVTMRFRNPGGRTL